MAVKFNGQYGSEGTVAYSASQDLTTSFYIKMKFALGASGQSQTYMMTKHNSYSILYGFNANTVEFFSGYDTNSQFRNASGVVVTDTNEHEVIYQYDGNVFTATFDGNVIGTVTSAGWVDTTNTYGITLASAGGVNFWNGTVYDLEVGTSPQALIADWTFQEGTGTQTSDLSGNGNTMNLGNFVWVNNYSRNADLSATSSLTATGTKSQSYSDSAVLSASSSLTAVSNKKYSGSVGLQSGSSLSVSANPIIHRSAGLNASATMTSNASVHQSGQKYSGSGTLSANASMGANVVVIKQARVNLSSVSSMQVQSEVTAVYDVTLSLNASGNMMVMNIKPTVDTVQLIGNRLLSIQLKGGLPVVDGQNIDVISGNSLNVKAQLTEQDGTPINLNEITSVRWGFGNTTTGLRKDLTTGITIDDAVNGIVTIHLSSADTSNRNVSTKHELTITDLLGNVSSVLRGNISIEQNII